MESVFLPTYDHLQLHVDGATNHSTLSTVQSQGTWNLTVLGPLSGSWVSQEGLKGKT